MNENTLRDKRRKKFFVVDNDLIDAYGEKIGVYGFAVYSLLLRHASSADTAFPSYQTIGKKFGFSERQAILTIDRLVKLGFIEKESRTSASGATTSNLYTLIDLPSLIPDPLGGVNDVHRGGEPGAYGGVNDVHTGGEPGAYNKDLVYKDPIDQNPIEEKPTNQPSSRALIGEERSVGFDSEPPQPEKALQTEQQEQQQQRLVGFDSEPQPPAEVSLEAQPEPEPETAIQAASLPPSSAGPPSRAARDRAVALLTDPQVGMAQANAEKFAERHAFAWLLAQVATWKADKKAEGVGGLYNRIDNQWAPEGYSDAFLASELYHRHYPLSPEQAWAWERWRRYGGLGIIGIDDTPPAWLDDLPDDLRDLLDELPFPQRLRGAQSAQAEGERRQENANTDQIAY